VVRSTTTHTVPWVVLGPVAAAIALLPLLRPSGPGNSSPVDAAIAVSVAATALWAGYTRQELRLPYALAVGVFMVGGAIASLAGPLPADGLLAVAHDLVLLTWCGVVVNVARSADALRWLLRAWAWSSVAWAVILIFAVATGNFALAGITDRTGVRASLTFGDPNYAANYFFLSLMIVMATRSPRKLGLRIVCYGVLLAALALTGSNGGILACAVGLTIVMLAYVARRWGSPSMLAALCAAALLGVGWLVAGQSGQVEQLAAASGVPLLRDSIGRSSQSAQERQWLVSETIALYEQGAPWGLGPDSTKPLLQTQLAPYAYQTHDDYVEALVERGVVGAIGLILLIGSLAARTWSVVTQPLNPRFAELFPRFSPLVGAMAGLAVSASYYQILHFRQVWTVFAIIGTIYVWGRKSPA
jgi:hypothetical protein